MNIREMHFDFKMKFNKLNSHKEKSFQVLEIDWLLNEGQDVFIKKRLESSLYKKSGFEFNQSITEDLSKLFTNVSKDINTTSSASSFYTSDHKEALLKYPTDYLHYINSLVTVENSDKKTKVLNIKVRQHEDEFKDSPFDSTSFKWKSMNTVFNSSGLKYYGEEGIKFKKVVLNYIRKPVRLQAGGLQNYQSLDSKSITTDVDCELSSHTHSEIVDISVFLASSQYENKDYNIKLNKLKILNNE